MPNRLTLNTALQMFSRLLELACGIVVNAALARHWGSTVFGQTGLVTGIAGLCSFLFDLGLGTLLVREISRDRRRARHFVVNGLVALVPLSILGTGCVVGIGLIAGSAALLPALLLAGLLMALSAATQVVRASFYAFERMEFESLAVAVDRLAYLAAGLWLAWQPPSIPALFALLAACKALNLAICSVAYRRAIAPQADPPAPALGTQAGLLRQGLPFGFNLVFSTIYVSADIVLLSALVGGANAGHYRAASMLVVPLTLLAVSLNTAIFPRMSASALHGRGGVAGYASFAVRIVTAAGIPLAVFVGLFAPQIVAVLYGPGYGPAVLMLQVLALVIPVRFLNHSLATALTACDRQLWRTVCAGIAALVNVALTVMLISRWQGLGACIATVLTDLYMVALLWLCLRRELGPESRFAPPAALQSLFISGLILVPLVALEVPLLPAAAVMALMYPLLLVRAGILSEGEIRLLAKRADS
ncbi:MAG: flippase [Candidatus Sericytochromatia bacterium]|nr:flippase [Candidatus Tanganyikabacteria bacterium]